VLEKGLVYQTLTKLGVEPTPDERAAIDAAQGNVHALRDGSDADALRAAVEALNRATEAFAARRMDRGVRQALAGRAIDTLA
jgi:molecular chaperone HscA